MYSGETDVDVTTAERGLEMSVLAGVDPEGNIFDN